MTEFIPLKTHYCIKKLLAGALLIVASQGMLSEPASAQGLLNRIRARINARMGYPPPPPFGLPVPPYAQRPRVNAIPMGEMNPRQPSQFRSPVGVPASGQPAPSEWPRVLATPTPRQYAPPGYRLAKPPIDDSFIRSPIEQTGYQTESQLDRPNPSPNNNDPTLARPRASLGISARDASPQRGVIVVEVNDGSAGKMGGIRVNDRIVSAAGRLIRDTSGLIRELALSRPGDLITLGVVRGDSMRELTVEMGDRHGKPVRGGSVAASSATEQPPSTPERAASTDASSSGNNILQGVGSALGNFFGGAPSPEAPSAGNASNTANSQANEVFELPAPVAEPELQSGDPLALPEDE